MNIVSEYPYGTPMNACYICGCSPRTLWDNKPERIVDWEKLIDFEGFLCICETCIETAASELGMLTRRRADLLKDHNKELVEENSDLRMQLGAAMDALTALRNLDAIYFPTPSNA